MARVELIIPKMGESVSEATIISWVKKVGEIVEIDETIIEIATDKVDSEVPSTHEGKLIEILSQIGDIVKVGQVFAILETEENEVDPMIKTNTKIEGDANKIEDSVITDVKKVSSSTTNSGSRFYSPLVRSIANKEGISMEELEKVPGTGKDARVTKSDMISYIKTREIISSKTEILKVISNTENDYKSNSIIDTDKSEIIEMDRIRKLISKNMIKSKQTSAHITSFVEADMTNIVNWRNSVKKEFKKRERQNITFTPIIIEAMAKAVKDFPMMNVSVDEDKIIIHNNINIGMATALADGNLIVPVIKKCQNKSLVGITKSVNDLASRARNSRLKPDEIQEGTITMTNVGTFGNLMGTPIINQPEVAILACGIIKKKPIVVETEYGDAIVIRHMMFLSLSYDHRVVDGALGGQFVRKVADYLEGFDTNTVI